MKIEKKLAEKIFQIIHKTIGTPVANLHEPEFDNSDFDTVLKALKSGFVSSIGKSIDDFEKDLCNYTGSKYAVAIVNGTSALHLALISCGVKPNDEILVPALTFVATANSILYAKATPHFVDSDLLSFGIDTEKLFSYLKENVKIKNNYSINKITGNRIYGIIPAHIFGMIGNIEELVEICNEFNLTIIEDAAEALGSFKNNVHAGLFGKCGCLSFNGNKIITTGGGGAIITNDKLIAKRARHISQTAKINHSFKYEHNELGFNYRMPALNASLGISQLKKIDTYIKKKNLLRNLYLKNFKNIDGVDFVCGPNNFKSNYWLNAIQINEKFFQYKEEIIMELNNLGYGCRPIWELMTSLIYFKGYPSMNIDQAKLLYFSTINIPSSPILSK